MLLRWFYVVFGLGVDLLVFGFGSLVLVVCCVGCLVNWWFCCLSFCMNCVECCCVVTLVFLVVGGL